MPLDALCLSGVIHELNTSLAGARVDKIYQPGRDEVVLALRTQSVGNVRLLLSANPAHPRLHLTTLPLENPEKPPMFCMLLRKHMSGARLLEIAQPPLERAAFWTAFVMWAPTCPLPSVFFSRGCSTGSPQGLTKKIP